MDPDGEAVVSLIALAIGAYQLHRVGKVVKVSKWFSSKPAKSIKKISDRQKHFKRGRESEKRVLKDMDLNKNSDKVIGTEGKSIPDAMTDTALYEIKDTKRVFMSKQLRIQAEVAGKEGLTPYLVTGKNTKVYNTVKKEFNIIRRNDLGSQK